MVNYIKYDIIFLWGDNMIDTHCHLEKKTYSNLEDIISHMGDNKIIVSGYDFESSKEVIKLIDKYPNIYGVIGFQPEEIDKINDDFYSFLEDNMSNQKIVGIGEIGLDYHYTKENSSLQKKVFINQIRIANKYNKPIVIHSRDAFDDTLEILKKECENTKIVMHCFGYSKEAAKEFLKFDLMFGIGGVVTFKNNRKTCEVVEFVDISRILLETDSPYLTPEPFRGQINEPYNIVYVAEKIAELKGISKEDVLQLTEDNAIRLFDLNV